MRPHHILGVIAAAAMSGLGFVGNALPTQLATSSNPSMPDIFGTDIPTLRRYHGPGAVHRSRGDRAHKRQKLLRSRSHH